MFVGAATSTLLNPFCGMVYDVRVYNRALPPVELRPLWGEMSHKLQVSWRAAHPPLARIFVSREVCALRLGLICEPVGPRLPTFEFETDTRLVFSWLQFGDIGAPTCVVGEWSAWSACSTLGIQQATTGAAQAAFKSRTRTVLSGAGSGCPDLQQIAQCGEQLECSFVLVVCVPGGGGLFLVPQHRPDCHPVVHSLLQVSLDRE
jgi:hypothetical protein